MNDEQKYSWCEKQTDTKRLDFLQKLTEKQMYTGRVIMRFSQNGRGWRLHETSRMGAPTSVRETIDDFIKLYAWLGEEE